jgi:glycosyltransferase involved in cell wall biosynthesis
VSVPLDVSAVLALSDDCPDLGEIIRQYGAEFASRGLAYEFVLVLDGLGEQKTERLRARIPSGHPVRLVHFNQAFGEERSLASGYREARGRHVVSLPAYLQLDPGDIHLVLEALRDECDVVVGWRVPRVDPWINRLQSWAYNKAMSAFTGVPLHDLNCGLVGMRRAIIDEVLVEGNVSRFLPVLANRQGFRVAEVRLRHLRERGRQGFFGVGVYVRRMLDVVALLFLTRFTRKPLRFFGAAGGIAVLLGLVVCGYLMLDAWLGWSHVGSLRNSAALVFGVALVVIGVQTFAIGLVGEIIIFTTARNVREYTVEREMPPGRPRTPDESPRAGPGEGPASRAAGGDADRAAAADEPRAGPGSAREDAPHRSRAAQGATPRRQGHDRDAGGGS